MQLQTGSSWGLTGRLCLEHKDANRFALCPKLPMIGASSSSPWTTFQLAVGCGLPCGCSGWTRTSSCGPPGVSTTSLRASTGPRAPLLRSTRCRGATNRTSSLARTLPLSGAWVPQRRRTTATSTRLVSGETRGALRRLPPPQWGRSSTPTMAEHMLRSGTQRLASSVHGSGQPERSLRMWWRGVRTPSPGACRTRSLSSIRTGVPERKSRTCTSFTTSPFAATWRA
mmetsp:Transcript_58617/g.156942  ORF Transcript_58617/g.156942 Transcript_58617/m.156942 type:complete len:227 (-) Transcript_58617:602-1282(-)